MLNDNKNLGSILITGGATREPIDGVRFLSNVSTGQTAAELSDQLMILGWRVNYLAGVGSRLPQRPCEIQHFQSFTDLDEKLRKFLGSHDFTAVIQCAAVSDYSPLNANPNIKLSTQPELTLRLKANHKILPRLKEYSRNKSIQVIGFKLTLNQSAPTTIEAARTLLNGDVDAVVANDWARVVQDRSQHQGQWVTRRKEVRQFTNLLELSSLLHAQLLEGPNDTLS